MLAGATATILDRTGWSIDGVGIESGQIMARVVVAAAIVVIVRRMSRRCARSAAAVAYEGGRFT